MPRQYRPKNRYQHGSKLSEDMFSRIVLLFTLGSSASEIAAKTGISLRSINALVGKLRKRVYDDAALDPLRLAHGDYGRPPADHPFWQHHRACLYDCPTLRDGDYPRPVAKEIATPWHPAGYEEWCGRCGVLPQRRSPYWGPLKAWSRMNNGLSRDTYAHHVVYLSLVGYTQVIAPTDWHRVIMQGLKREPL